MITDDPVIKRIREARFCISEQHDHDAKKLVEHYIKLEKKNKRPSLNLNEMKRNKEDILSA